ncbi:hypothetical protein CO101_01305 [Candidatus Berkelbacteria bacterium CG_4_9_14_3_um_filter_39_23]|uniref:PrgI family protein n=2 Tax=Candidatus Berkelbacteria TaxID=1618330 RepID=A0A2M7CHF6_9BACT|nr:MAG: hypothetical protein COV39_03220 [Candidatus Berkelbacteria bacterium CG11_big_fil_rev_8_21_14_0_20_40_23]PIV25072.1 MAG: hypothetical protein COS38_03585 [Candidatus Berkelbacteria bacterium CG03_land_8_20_14_0_80_40_36]PIX30580.1 MAG: hypothetical protein COZ62_01885 [Candidatus Berkelbacteria bacterium CG_4_8_14_3_um_filter_39_27]PIZ28745.1 MAG: hypothetical protein COY44_02565 [Candidatus Berkelbacteria bacterium CG_4_10_14_0_8_um_filter_39_42]PJB51632.1 MAG: hypothetical protein CO
MPQYKVPQNLDLPDKILGPLTLIQLGYLLIGGMIAYSIYRIGNLILTILIALPILILTLGVAFVKVQNQPFGKFVFNFILFAINPKTRVWHKGNTNATVKIDTNQIATTKAKVIHKSLNQGNLTRVSHILDE